MASAYKKCGAMDELRGAIVLFFLLAHPLRRPEEISEVRLQSNCDARYRSTLGKARQSLGFVTGPEAPGATAAAREKDAPPHGTYSSLVGYR